MYAFILEKTEKDQTADCFPACAVKRNAAENPSPWQPFGSSTPPSFSPSKTILRCHSDFPMRRFCDIPKNNYANMRGNIFEEASSLRYSLPLLLRILHFLRLVSSTPEEIASGTFIARQLGLRHVGIQTRRERR